MMLGTRETFDYAECDRCQTLQLVRIPEGLGAYYPGGYYSFDSPRLRSRNAIVRFLRRERDRAAALGGSLLGRILLHLHPEPDLTSLRLAGLRGGESVLDVGSGGGHHLLALRELGFGRLEGIDPFLDQDRDLPGGIKLRRRSLEDWDGGPYELIMFQHSLEHVADPGGALRRARALLAPGGRCFVRIPTVSSRAWKEYGVDWVQIDAPRHIVLFSRVGFRMLAESTGWKVAASRDDSTAFQFWGSEQNRRDIPLLDTRSQARSPGAFDAAQMREFARRARELNRREEGDQVAVLLYPDADSSAANKSR